MQCSKSFSLVVAENPPPPPGVCLNFDLMDWEETFPDFVTLPSGDTIGPAQLSSPGDFVFLGGLTLPEIPAIDCLFEFTITDNGDDRSGSIDFSTNAGTFLSVDLATLVNGLNSIPFTIPASSAGDQFLITLSMSLTVGDFIYEGTVSCLDECFFCAEQTAHADCPPPCTGPGGDGVVAAGEVVSKISQADADALAMAAAEADAQANLSCTCLPDWSTLAWGTPTITVFGGSASFTPNNGSGAAFNANANAPIPPAFPPAAGTNALATNTGTLVSALPLSGNCNLHFDVAGGAASVANYGWTVDVKLDGAAVAHAEFVGPFNTSMDLPFSVNGGTQIDVIIEVDTDAHNLGPAGAGNITMSGLLTNV